MLRNNHSTDQIEDLDTNEATRSYHSLTNRDLKGLDNMASQKEGEMMSR